MEASVISQRVAKNVVNVMCAEVTIKFATRAFGMFTRYEKGGEGGKKENSISAAFTVDVSAGINVSRGPREANNFGALYRRMRWENSSNAPCENNSRNLALSLLVKCERH